MATGSINDPSSKNYHLEISSNSSRHGEYLQKLITKFGLNPKTIKRRNKYVVYLKKSEEISDFLISHSPRGITKVDGLGMYSKQAKGVLMTCVKNNQVVALKNAIKSLDENAFVIVCDANEVYGKGFKHI